MSEIKKKLPTNLLVGYWQNWGAGPGYKKGTSAEIKLTDIHDKYNVIIVSFMKSEGGGLPNFTPYNCSEQEFKEQIKTLHEKGKVVLISLGGANANISLSERDDTPFYDRILQICDNYGFDGLDIDLEQSAIEKASNQVVIPKVLKDVKDYYRKKGKDFIISMAPEYPYLRNGDNAKYAPYIKGLEGYYDYISPQYYNQNGDGLNGGGKYLRQNDDDKKEDFLYYLTEAITTGTQDYIKIPSDKFVIGLPSNNDAANNGYVEEPSAVKKALDRLKEKNLLIRGLMTWSVNWDNGKSSDGKSYNWEFANRYGYILDRPKPVFVISISSPSDGEEIAKGLEFNFRAKALGAESVEFFIDEKSYKKFTKEPFEVILKGEDTPELGTGDHILKVVAQDSEGAKSEASVKIKMTEGRGRHHSDD